MLSTFEKLLSAVKQSVDTYPQLTNSSASIALITANQKIYSAVIQDALDQSENCEVTHLLEKISENGDKRITEFVYIWHTGGLDLPSYAVRKILYDFSENPEEMIMYLNGEKGVVAIRMAKTLFPRDRSENQA